MQGNDIAHEYIYPGRLSEDDEILLPTGDDMWVKLQLVLLTSLEDEQVPPHHSCPNLMDRNPKLPMISSQKAALALPWPFLPM